MTLTDFLLARLAEDEELARAVEADTLSPDSVIDTGGDPWPSERAFAVRFTTGHVLVECESKRAIIALADEASGTEIDLDMETAYDRNEAGEPYVGDQILSALASVYSEHPDYNPAWTTSA